MAAYCRDDSKSHLRANCPYTWDQLQAQHLVTDMGELTFILVGKTYYIQIVFNDTWNSKCNLVMEPW